MDLSEAKRIMRLVAHDDSLSGRAWEGQEESAGLILSEMNSLESKIKELKTMSELKRITVIVSRGIVQGIYATLPADTDVEVEVLDFDNARADTDNPEALVDMRELATVAAETQRQIY
jgi:hypothetical protein